MEVHTVEISSTEGRTISVPYVRKSLQTSDPDPVALPSRVCSTSPPKVGWSQRLQVHLDVVKLLLGVNLHQVGVLLGLAVGGGRVPEERSSWLEVETAHVDEGGLDPSGGTGVYQLGECRHNGESGDQEESS